MLLESRCVFNFDWVHSVRSAYLDHCLGSNISILGKRRDLSGLERQGTHKERHYLFSPHIPTCFGWVLCVYAYWGLSPGLPAALPLNHALNQEAFLYGDNRLNMKNKQTWVMSPGFLACGPLSKIAVKELSSTMHCLERNGFLWVG
jgi:hypothetical protein